MFPPSPESPAVRFTRGGSSATPRVGMLVSNAANNEDDDDVSVLTFHTFVTKDTSSLIDWGNRSDDNKDYFVQDEGIKKSLSHISEESHNSGDGSGSKAKDDECTRDDESLSLAESVLDSTNKLLSSIGSSSYYSGLNTKLNIKEKHRTQETFSPAPKPNAKHPSPVKLESSKSLLRNSDYVNGSSLRKSTASISPEKSLEKKGSNDRFSNGGNDKRPAAIHQNKMSYLYDEPDENKNKSNYKERNCMKHPSKSSEDKLSKLEAETKQLQRLLREKQMETKLAMSELDASIKRANALLK